MCWSLLQLMANDLGLSHVVVSLVYMALQLLVSLGFVWGCGALASYLDCSLVLVHWVYLICALVVLTDSLNPTDYLKKMRKRDPELGVYIGTNYPQVQMTTHTGKKRLTLAADVEQLFRIIQRIG